MKKFMLGLLLVVAMVTVVSCSQDSLAQDDLVSVRFSKLEARAIDDDIYNVTGDATWGSASVQIGKVEDYYWTYCAIKNDDAFTSGETFNSSSNEYEFVDWADGPGLSGSKKFSAGEWVFELKAYASADDRKNRATSDKAIFEGEVTTGKLTTSQTVTVPMSSTYVSGEGAFDFTISAAIDQTDDSSYEITKVEMVFGTEYVELTKGDEAWTGSKSGIASGKKDVEIRVYVDHETTARVSKKIGTAYILHGLTTNVTGSATITLTANTVDLEFNAGLPSSLPANIAVGDTVTYGKIPSSDTDITWNVLEVKEDKMLVISEKVLFNMKHYDTDGMDDWDDSLIKAYLNKEGDDGFVSQYGLGDVAIVAASEDESGYNAGDVFLLSMSEIQFDYFNDRTSRIAYDLEENASHWWSRTAGDSTDYDFMYVYDDGYYDCEGESATKEYGVRPAFWIDIE